MLLTCPGGNVDVQNSLLYCMRRDGDSGGTADFLRTVHSMVRSNIPYVRKMRETAVQTGKTAEARRVTSWTLRYFP